MAISEETLIDAPVTPAPVFAYRALKAVFWGEEDTPGRFAKGIDSNISQIAESTKQLDDVGVDPAIILTPVHKRKYSALAQPSPTKSILRAPGIHTPRRALLKDLNVTFKDLRKSVSPEMQAQGLGAMKDDKENRPIISTTTTATNKLSSGVAISAQTSKAAVTATKSNRSPASLTGTNKQDTTNMNNKQRSISTTAPMATTVNSTTFDAELYMRSTEKDMKKLIKYGQKMREYARRHENENTKLRLMLDELQAENERLRKQIDVMGGSSGSTDDRTATDTREINARGVQPKTTAKPQRGSKIGVMRNHMDRASEAGPMCFGNSPAPSTVPPLPKTRNTSNTKPSLEKTHRSTLEPNFNPKLTHDIQAQFPISSTTNPNPPMELEPQIHYLPLRHPPDSTTTPTAPVPATSRLAPDRLAAARARVRMKAELRRASAETDIDPDVNASVRTDVEPKARKVDAGSSSSRKVAEKGRGSKNDVDKVETSLVDWAGL